MRRRRTKLQRRIQIVVRVTCMLFVCVGILFVGMKLLKKDVLSNKYVEKSNVEIDETMPEIQVELLTINPYSRPGIGAEKIKNIVVHYTANPGSTAMQNRNYFEGLKESRTTKASSHFIVGLDGEIVQCVPTREIAYASNHRNKDTVSIETCHWTEMGNYTEETYDALVELTAWLCKKFDLTEGDIIRHYDVTGKICPKYFVENEEAWEQFKEDVKEALGD